VRRWIPAGLAIVIGAGFALAQSGGVPMGAKMWAPSGASSVADNARFYNDLDGGLGLNAGLTIDGGVVVATNLTVDGGIRGRYFLSTAGSAEVAVEMVSGAIVHLCATPGDCELACTTSICTFGGVGVSASGFSTVGSTDMTLGAGGAINLRSGTTSFIYDDATNITIGRVTGGVRISGDATSPVLAAFGVAAQDAQPTGAHVIGDMYVTSAGVLKICTAAGTPGTWVSVGAQ